MTAGGGESPLLCLRKRSEAFHRSANSGDQLFAFFRLDQIFRRSQVDVAIAQHIGQTTDELRSAGSNPSVILQRRHAHESTVRYFNLVLTKNQVRQRYLKLEGFSGGEIGEKQRDRRIASAFFEVDLLLHHLF